MGITNPFRINIDQILDKGLRLSEPIGLQLLSETLANQNEGLEFKAVAPSRLEATLTKVSGGVLLTGKMAVEVTAVCKRCLVETGHTLPVDFTLNFIPRGKREEGDEDEARDDRGHGERAGSFELDTADQELFDGKTIDLDPIVREQVLLALPMDVVCKDDCKGLCPMCGQNLNEKQCGCESKFVDPRLAVLKDIKLS